MWFADSVYLVNQLARLKIEDNDGVIAFRSGKQPTAFEIDSEVVEVPFYVCRQLVGLDLLDWRSYLTPGFGGEYPENHDQD